MPRAHDEILKRRRKLHPDCKGSRFTLGVWVELCSPDVAQRLQPSATVRNVRNRSQQFALGPHGRAYGKFCKRVHFWRFQRCVASFRLAGVALCDIPTCFTIVCRTSFCVACAIYFCDVFRRCVAFVVAGAALWRPLMSFCMAGTAL